MPTRHRKLLASRSKLTGKRANVRNPANLLEELNVGRPSSNSHPTLLFNSEETKAAQNFQMAGRICFQMRPKTWLGTELFHNELSALSPGWGGRDRTSEWRNQNPLPYRLATPQQSGPEHGIDQRDLFRHCRSIEGVTPFQQAAGPNFTPKSGPIDLPLYIKGHCFGGAGPVFAFPAGRIPPGGELRERRFRGKTAAAISQKARLSS
jgi:hypothetical protein